MTKTSNSSLETLSTQRLSELAVAAFDALAAKGEAAALARLTGLAGEAIGRAFPRPREVIKDPEVRQTRTRDFPITFYGINEAKPGRRWKALFDATWPGYKAWYESSDGRQRPDLATAQAKLLRHMPELVPTYERLVKLAGSDKTAAAMLTMWDPPKFLPGCSQLAVADPEPMLCRNYDYAPELFECVSMSTDFNRRVIGTSDCLWGLLDGMNDAGLVVSLAFGGESGSGAGFGIPLVVRYLLEVAETVDEARAVLERVPVNMAYNITVMDADGQRATAFVSPNRRPEFSSSPAATNHRGDSPTDPNHARKFRSVERRKHLADLESDSPDAAELAGSFLDPGLRSTDYSGAFGTLYTALYRPSKGTVEYHWPDRVWNRSFDSEDESIAITLHDGDS